MHFIPIRIAAGLTPALLSVLLLPASRCAIQEVSAHENLQKAAELLKSGDALSAREAYEEVLIADPGNLSAQEGEVACSEGLALKARSAGNSDEALQYLLQAKKFAPRSARLLYDLGVLEDQMKLYKDADASLALAEQIDPRDSRVWYASARVKMDLGQLDAAEPKMIAYLKVHPDDATAHYGLGRVYQLGIKYEKARTEYRRSIELKPVQTEAYFQLGDMALQEGSFDEAILNFEKTLSRNPEHGGALTGLGETYFKKRQFEKALGYLQHAVVAASDYQTGHYYLGLTLARLGKPKESQKELEIAETMANAENKRSSIRRQLDSAAGDRQAKDH